MKFPVDEQLPQILADWLSEKGYATAHVSALLTNAKIPDDYICKRSMAESRVGISKYSDFFNTILSRDSLTNCSISQLVVYTIGHYSICSEYHSRNCSTYWKTPMW
jgi:predicted nuclease of predicted toxin-antitoxin system